MDRDSCATGGTECRHHDHDNDAQVTLALLMPRDQAATLVATIDSHKRQREIGSVSINIMHVFGIGTTNVPREVVSGDGVTWIDRSPQRGAWWPVQLARLAVSVLLSAVLATLDRPYVNIILAVVCCWIGASLTARRGCRWRRVPRSATTQREGS